MTRLLPAAALACVAAVLTACGSSGDPSADAANAADKQDTARIKLQQCLRDNGVDLPAPGSGDQGANVRVRITAATRDKLQKAMNGPCKAYRQQAFGNVSDEQRQEFRDRFAKFASCMRRHGVDVPDPTAGGGRPAGALFRIDPDNPKVKAAMQACQSNLPAQGGRGPGVAIGPPPGGGSGQ